MNRDYTVQLRRALTLKGASRAVPVSGTFELTPRCNLGCRMCYIRLTPEEMKKIGREQTAAEWIRLAQEAIDAGMLFLLITGGEPTLRTDFGEIYTELSKMGLSISINSNGTLIDEKLRKIFHQFPPAQMNITLYGTSKEEYGKMCQSPESFEKVKSTLDWLEAEGILIHLNATMTSDNLDHWEALEEFALHRNLELRMTTYCFPTIRRDGCHTFNRLAPELAGELTVKDLYYRGGKEAVRNRLKDLEQPLNSCKLDLGDPIQCLAAKSQFWVNWDGSMVPCGMLPVPRTAPFQDGFENAWKKLYEQTAQIRLCPECVSCAESRTCMNCAAVTYTETGRFDGKPEYVCRMNRAYREALKKYGQEI